MTTAEAWTIIDRMWFRLDRILFLDTFLLALLVQIISLQMFSLHL